MDRVGGDRAEALSDERRPRIIDRIAAGTDRRPDGRDEAIKLSSGGIVLLTPGAVSTFVPNPDHIHVTGVSADSERVVSLHLYGRAMTDFNVYDLVAGTRRRVEAGRVDN